MIRKAKHIMESNVMKCVIGLNIVKRRKIGDYGYDREVAAIEWCIMELNILGNVL